MMIREILAQFQTIKTEHGHHGIGHAIQLYIQSGLAFFLTGVTMVHVEMWVRIGAGGAAFMLSLFTTYKIYLDIRLKHKALKENSKDKTND